MEKTVDHWWHFKPNVDVNALTQEVITDFERQGLAWLKSRHNPKHIQNLLEKRGDKLRKVAKYFEEQQAAKQPPSRLR